MMLRRRWSVRGVPKETIEKLREVQQQSEDRFLLGELLAEAVDDWFDRLPDADEAGEYPDNLGMSA
jgi:hypothetical protein